MPRWFSIALVVSVILSLVPLALIARKRATFSEEPRVHLVQDMDNQPRYRAQAANPLFADGRAMRPPVEGSVARGELRDDDLYERGRTEEAWLQGLPAGVTLSDELLLRGQQRFNVFCTPCHGLVGEGDGMVARRADRLQEGTWVPPASLHSELVRGRPDGHLFNAITHGIRSMPGYGSQIPVEDRWAVVAYIRALQLSQNARPEQVPESYRASLGTE
jgi:mono/diheme cytochrome c family protein